jgi:hypothetical protein
VLATSSLPIVMVIGPILPAILERTDAFWYAVQAIRVGLVSVIAWENRALFRRRKHVIGILLAGCCFASCGGTSPTAPTPPPSFLEGTWQGSMTISRAGLPDTVAQTTWTIAVVELTGGTTYTATVNVQDSWLAINTTLSTSLTPPSPGGQLVTSGTYRSPRGCDGSVASGGTAQPTRIEATFNGVDCDQLPQTSVFVGRVVLTKR